jgi:hypothetical protein
MIKINQEFSKMVKLLDVFKTDRVIFDINRVGAEDKEVVHNHRFIKKEVSDMNELVERMANIIVEQNKKNKELESMVVS